jgi:hypothetical protein
MKKFFAIAFIAASLVACGGGETKTEETPVDTTAAAPAVDTVAPVVDTTAKVDTTAAPAAAPAEEKK